MILQIKFNIVLTSKYTSSFTLKVLFCCIISTTMHENKFKTLLCVKMAICYDIAFSTQKYWRIFISGNIFFLRFQNGTVKRYHFTIIIKKKTLNVSVWYQLMKTCTNSSIFKQFLKMLIIKLFYLNVCKVQPW